MWCGHLNSSSHSWIESRYFCSITLIFAHTLTSFLLLFHMHTYFPSIFPTRAALCIYFHPLRGTSALTLWKTSHDMARWVPGSHLNSCMRSNQSRRQSNQTGLPCRLPCPLYAWSHRHMKMEKGDFNFAVRWWVRMKTSWGWLENARWADGSTENMKAEQRKCITLWKPMQAYSLDYLYMVWDKMCTGLFTNLNFNLFKHFTSSHINLKLTWKQN